jgi:Carbon-nitrogen hydrolase
MRARGLRELTLVARREVATRMRGTAFRVSTIVLLAAMVAGIAIAAALTGHPQRFTVAVTAQAPPAVAAMVRADGQAAGLRITAVAAADRGAAVRLVEQGKAAAAVAAGGETIWKARPDSALQPVLSAAVQQAIITQRAASLGLSPGAIARLLAPARITSTQLHADSQRRMTELPVLYAHALGVPVVFVNQVGPLLPIGGILGHLMDPGIWRLRGQSRIVDSDGSVLGQLAEDEGVLTADVVTDPARKHYDAQPSFGG